MVARARSARATIKKHYPCNHRQPERLDGGGDLLEARGGQGGGERGGQGRVGGGGGGLGRAGPDHLPAAPAGRAGQLREQAGLADAGLANHGGQPAAARAGLLQAGDQGGALGGAADEGRLGGPGLRPGASRAANLLGQLAGVRLGGRAQLEVEGGGQLGVGGQGLAAAAQAGQAAHQAAAGPLVQRVVGQQAPVALGRVGRAALGLGEAQQGGQVAVAQGGARRGQPVVVQLGQQVAGVEVGRPPEVGQVGPAGQALELPGIDRQRVGAQADRLRVGRDQRGADGAAQRVEQAGQAAPGGARRGIGPEQLGQQLAGLGRAGAQQQVGQQGAHAPAGQADRPARPLGAHPAEQPERYCRGKVHSPIVVRNGILGRSPMRTWPSPPRRASQLAAAGSSPAAARELLLFWRNGPAKLISLVLQSEGLRDSSGGETFTQWKPAAAATRP